MCIGSFFETRGLAPLSSTDADGVASFRGFPAKRGSRSPSVADDYLSSGADATTRMSRKSTKRLRGDDADDADAPTSALRVANLSRYVTEPDVKKLFALFSPNEGGVRRVTMPREDDLVDGAHRGFAVVELENEAAARSATQMDGLLIADKHIKVCRFPLPSDADAALLGDDTPKRLLASTETATSTASARRGAANAATCDRAAAASRSLARRVPAPPPPPPPPPKAEAPDAGSPTPPKPKPNPKPRPVERDDGAKRVWVGNVRPDATAQELSALFSSFGPIARCELSSDASPTDASRDGDGARAGCRARHRPAIVKSGQHAGHGAVDFRDASAAAAAVAAAADGALRLDGASLEAWLFRDGDADAPHSSDAARAAASTSKSRGSSGAAGVASVHDVARAAMNAMIVPGEKLRDVVAGKCSALAALAAAM